MASLISRILGRRNESDAEREAREKREAQVAADLAAARKAKAMQKLSEDAAEARTAKQRGDTDTAHRKLKAATETMSGAREKSADDLPTTDRSAASLNGRRNRSS